MLLPGDSDIFESKMDRNAIVIGIAGGTGSGKTTVTEKILSRLDPSRVIVLQHDHYYKDISSFNVSSPELVNFDHPDSLDTPMLVDHVRSLKHRKSIERPIYDFSTYRRSGQTIRIAPRTIIIIEGILIFVDRALRELMDIKIYVDTDADERLLRRLRRDVLERQRSIESVMDQYMATVKPMHLEFVEPSKHWADVIIPRGGGNEVAIDMVTTRIREMHPPSD